MSNLTEQADGKSRRSKSYKWFIKRRKRRLERKRMNSDMDYVPQYGKYKGWQL